MGDTTPSKDEIDVALESLRSDSNEWHAGAAVAEALQADARSLLANSNDFSFSAIEKGFDKTYESTVDRTASMLGKCATHFSQLGSALGEAAKIYEQEEYKNRHEIEGIY